MTKKLLFLLGMLFVTVPAFAQNIVWMRTYGGPWDDEGHGVEQTSDGGYIVAGCTNSFDAWDFYLIKTDSSGQALWTHHYGNSDDADLCYSVQQTSDGGYIMAGESGYFDWNQVYLIKVNSSGDLQWFKAYGGYGTDVGYCVQQTKEGGYVVAGVTGSSGAGLDDVYLIKTNSLGDSLWAHTYGGADDDVGDFVRQTKDGGYIIAGYTSSFGEGVSDMYLIKTNSLGQQIWSKTYGGSAEDKANCVIQTEDGGYILTGFTVSFGDGDGDVYVIKTDSLGDTVWTRTYGGVGNEDGNSIHQTSDGGYIIAGFTNSFGAGLTDVYLIKTDSTGQVLWTGTYGGADYDEGNSVDETSDGQYIVAGSTFSYGAGWVDVYLLKIKGGFLVLKDGSASHDAIPNDSFTVYKVHNDPPNMTQDSLGVLTTDSLGRMFLPKDWFKVGDSVKVERLVDTVKAVKHKSILKNMYYIKIDNGKFDTTTGAIYYDTLTTEAEQEVIVGHTTVMYDLLVSVEWDADQQYLQSLLDGFRYASNYLYDVTDGQLYLNIVRIYDNKKWWDSADVWIYGSNMRWPEAWVGDRELGHGIFGSGNEQRLFFPRIFYFNSYDGNRNLTYDDNQYPYDWTIAQTSYDDNHNGTIEYPKEYKAYPPSRTLAHEFGHYGIGFFDEYCRCPCREGGIDDVFPGNGTADYDFGLMDDQLKVGVAQNSEMSCSTIQYSDRNRRVTCQWTGREDRSCWDYFQWNFQKTYSGVFAAVKVPRTQMFAGPNDNLQNLNYDVGRLIPSTGAIIDHEGGARTVIATLFDQNADPLPKAKVDLKKFDDTDSSRVIEQGETADSPNAGQIRCLGYNNWDQVLGSSAIVIEGKGKRGWLFGEGQIGKSGLSSFQNTYRSSLDGDSLDLFLRAVIGDYPLIHATSLSTGTPEYVLYASRLFSANPTLELRSDGNPAQIYTLQATPTGYSVSIPDEIGISGMFTSLALDDSAYTFFVNTPYCLTQIVDTAFAGILIGPQGGCKLYLDNLNSSLEKILILSSPYPPIRIGLDPLSEQAGEVYSLSSYPSGSLLGSNSLIIRYADSDLHTQSEATLGVFKWNETLQMWESLCGFVDTLNNVVGASINSLGVYAAFTTGYLRGDANRDGVIDISDVVYLINYLFIHGPAPVPLAAGDATCDGVVDVSDVVYLINYLFVGGPAPCK
jgi:hypothetical protein